MKAIILAAGVGKRLQPFTNKIPKALVKVNGIPIIERQIEYFLEIGVSEIVIVTGYLSEQLDYLASKYDRLRLIHNEQYEEYNNIYSVYLVKDRMGDSYVSEADVFMHRNYLIPQPTRSCYFGGFRRGFAHEWILRFDEHGRVYRIDVEGGAGVILAGLSYWTTEDARILRNELEDKIREGNFGGLYWDDIHMANLDKLDVFLQEIETSAWTEIDTPEDLEEAHEREKRYRST